MDVWLIRLAVVALVVAACGGIAQLDVRYQRQVGEDFLARGVWVIATETELDVRSGKGGSFVDVVRIGFRTADGQEIRTELTNPLGDPEGAPDGRQPPAAGTRYAPPLQVLYRPTTPTEVMALRDARDVAHPGMVMGVTWMMMAVGVSGAAACGARLLRAKVPV